MKITLSLASLNLASAFVETTRGGGRSLALRASPRQDDDKIVTTEIRDVRDVVAGLDQTLSGKYVGGKWVPSGGKSGDTFLDTRVPPPAGFGNATPMPLTDGPVVKLPTRPAISRALPFAPCPAALDGTLAGDAGFDPCGFADGPTNLANYREAEVKHGRLAMLAAAGWPLAELWDAKIAGVLDLAPALNEDGRVPSVLNGGMGKISITYWLGCVVLAAGLDVYGSFFATKKDGYVAGDFGFDPLGFYPRSASPKDARSRERLQLSEIKHGRLAMLAITAFAAQEFVTEVPIVDQTPLFFRPIWDVLMDQVPGYYIPPEAVETVVPAAVEAVASTAMEATAVAPEVAVPAAVEAVASTAAEATAVAPQVAVPVAVEATAGIPPTATIESSDELAAANTRIVELEAKLAQIDALIR